MVLVVRHGYPDDFSELYESIDREYPESEWIYWHDTYKGGAPYPHCDQRILHAPGECAVCDLYAVDQKVRIRDRVAFTGHEPLPSQTPCPADEARPPDSTSWHGRWGGNIKA